MTSTSLKLSLILMGAGGMIAQIVLLRELLISFSGNELTIGIILANWLLLEALGAFFLGKLVDRAQKKIEVYVILQLVYSTALPLAIYLSRVFKNFILTTPGEGIGFIPVFYTSFLILLPASVIHGALFTWGCRLYTQLYTNDAVSVGRVYILETIGSIIGGLIITYPLIQYFNSFEISFLVGLASALICLLLLWPSPALSSPQNVLWEICLLFTILFSYLAFASPAKAIHDASIQSQWKGLRVVHYENSIYGNIAVTKQGEQFVFYTDGLPSITAPFPDIASLEDLVHFPLLAHNEPKSILVLSGGAGGMLTEILKHPVTHVSYVELDPLLLKLVGQFSTPLTQTELSDRRVKVHYTDSRFFVQTTEEKFDVIFIGLSSPQELQTNRLFSAEFFSIAGKKLNYGGILVLSIPGSLTYISEELKDLNGCILDTLKSVFSVVKIIPGETNLFLAFNDTQVAPITAADMAQRLKERNIEARLFNEGYLRYRLDEQRLKWFLRSLENREEKINSDFRPVAVFFSLSHWSALFSPHITPIFKRLETLQLSFYSLIVIVLTIFLAALFIRLPSLSIYSIPYALFTSGFADMLLSLSIIFTFQTLYGYLYFQISLLITIFMAGLAAGSLFFTKKLAHVRKENRLFIITELLVAALVLILPFVFSVPAAHLDDPRVYIALYLSFLVMSFLTGALIGFQFPLAACIYYNFSVRKEDTGQKAGLLYGSDLVGGFFGGLLGGVLFLPILGLMNSSLLMAAVKISSLVIFLVFLRLRN